jgi:LmbE family N-acetylglucosaminyl deacetylase
MITAGDCHLAWQCLPQGNLDDIIGTGTCLILAPHPDDESLGCGGLIAACIQAGRLPWVAILTDGVGSHPNSCTFPPDRLRQVRAEEVKTALRHLGLPPERLVLLNQPDTAAPTQGPEFDAALATLVRLIHAEPNCTSILAPWRHDPHCDHEAASILAASVARAASVRHVAYPVWGWTLPADTTLDVEPGSGFRLDISPFLPAKRAAIHAHRSQYGDLITDDPSGFSLPPDLLSVFDSAFETFISA